MRCSGVDVIDATRVLWRIQRSHTFWGKKCMGVWKPEYTRILFIYWFEQWRILGLRVNSCKQPANDEYHQEQRPNFFP